MDRSVFETDDLINTHAQHQARLNKTIQAQTLTKTQKSLLSSFARRKHNRESCKLDKPSTNILASVQYRVDKEIPSLRDDVVEGMLNLPWLKVYGLNVTQIMELPYDEWRDMHARLSKYETDRPPSPSEQVVKMVGEVVNKIDQLSEGTLLLVRTFMSGKGKRTHDNGSSRRTTRS